MGRKPRQVPVGDVYPGWPAERPAVLVKAREDLLKERLAQCAVNPRSRRISQLRRDLVATVRHKGKDGGWHVHTSKQGLSGRRWVRERKAIMKAYRQHQKDQAAKEAP